MPISGNHCIKRISIMYISIAFLLLFCFASSSWAEKEVEPINSPQKARLIAGIVESKTKNTIALADRVFAVSKKTAIHDLDDKKIPLWQLPIPCDAVISYGLRVDQNPLCFKIKVERIRKNFKSPKE